VIKAEREQLILDMLEDKGILPVKELYAALAGVSPVTVRRDIAQMATDGKLDRVRGGVKRKQGKAARSNKPEEALQDEMISSMESDLELADEPSQDLKRLDVIILPPIDTQMAKTIHRRAHRTGILCLDESWPDGDGVYLGIDNEHASYEIGCLAGSAHEGDNISCLVIGHDEHRNTRDRARGFLRGLRESFRGEVQSISVHAGGGYMEAFRQTRDALEAIPNIDIIFGINDHTVLGAIDAARQKNLTDIAAYGIGGEGDLLFKEMEKNQLLRGVAGMFPEVVARCAINAIARYFPEKKPLGDLITPYRILTPANFTDYYEKSEGRWHLRPAMLDKLAPLTSTAKTEKQKHSIMLIRHYPTHNWYMSLSAELEACSKQLGYKYKTASLKSQVADELRYTRRAIARRASQMIRPGNTIIVNGGEASYCFARQLGQHKDLTVITNSLQILDILNDFPNIKVHLTGGEYRPQFRDLVGPSVSTAIRNLRVDMTFLSVDGLSQEFGASFNDLRNASCAGIFGQYSREIVVLADHSTMGIDSTYRALPFNDISNIITDFGVSAQQRLDYSAAGVGLIVADDTK